VGNCLVCIYQFLIPTQHQIFKISFFHKSYLSFEKNYLSSNIPENHQTICKTTQNILECLKHEQDICIKNVMPSQKTAFMFTPALRVLKVIQAVAVVKLIDVKKITSLTRL